MRLRSLLSNLALLVVALLVALSLAELVVRLLEKTDLLPGERGTALFPEVEYSGTFKLSTNKVLLFELDPKDPLVNSDGFRDREFPVARSAAARILMLGDSVTFGHGIPTEATFPKLLEERLNRQDPSGRRYEVMNFGVPGYNTRQELEFFAWKGRKYAPDLVVLGWVLNDCWPAETLLNELDRIGRGGGAGDVEPSAGGASLPAPEARSPSGSAASPAAPAPVDAPPEAAGGASTGLLARSRLFELVRDRLERATSKRPRYWLPLEQICAVPQNWSLVSRSFAELAKIAARDRFSVAVVIFPMLVDFEHYPYRRLHLRVAQEARRNGFAVLDLLGTFKSHRPEELQLLPGDTTHPGVLGHRLAAERIHAFLREAGLPRNIVRAPRPEAAGP